MKTVGVEPYTRLVRGYKRQIIETYLRAHAGNSTQAAKSLGISRPYLGRLMRELQARRPA